MWILATLSALSYFVFHAIWIGLIVGDAVLQVMRIGLAVSVVAALYIPFAGYRSNRSLASVLTGLLKGLGAVILAPIIGGVIQYGHFYYSELEIRQGRAYLKVGEVDAAQQAFVSHAVAHHYEYRSKLELIHIYVDQEKYQKASSVVDGLEEQRHLDEWDRFESDFREFMQLHWPDLLERGRDCVTDCDPSELLLLSKLMVALAELDPVLFKDDRWAAKFAYDRWVDAKCLYYLAEWMDQRFDASTVDDIWGIDHSAKPLLDVSWLVGGLASTRFEKKDWVFASNAYSLKAALLEKWLAMTDQNGLQNELRRATRERAAESRYNVAASEFNRENYAGSKQNLEALVERYPKYDPEGVKKLLLSMPQE